METVENRAIMLDFSSDIIGAIGVSLILLAYFLNLVKKIENTSKTYLLMNIFGAGLACVSSVLIHSVPFTILEGTWAIVSLVALFRK